MVMVELFPQPLDGSADLHTPSSVWDKKVPICSMFQIGPHIFYSKISKLIPTFKILNLRLEEKASNKNTS
jgi:hypothetical protein